MTPMGEGIEKLRSLSRGRASRVVLNAADIALILSEIEKLCAGRDAAVAGIVEIARDLGCGPDNEAILHAIATLKQEHDKTGN